VDWREDFDDSLLDQEALTFLIEYELDATAAGITRRVMSDGLGGLSEKQLNVFKKYVVDEWLEATHRPGIRNFRSPVSLQLSRKKADPRSRYRKSAEETRLPSKVLFLVPTDEKSFFD
jgi:hypothetical protein